MFIEFSNNLKYDPISMDSTDAVKLSALGSMTGSCETFELNGESRIRASYEESYQKVTGIEFYKFGISLSFGLITDKSILWNFTKDN